MHIRFTIFILLSVLFFNSCTEEPDRITNIIGPEDWQGPVIEWLTPPDSEVRGTVGIDIAVSDSSDIASVRLYLDGLPKSELTAPPYRFELVTDSLQDGVHILEARAADEYGNLGISPILRVNVMNSIAEGPRLLWVPDNFETIQSAINAAQDFDTIRVRDGIYYETLNLFGKGLWIESENGPMRCTVDADFAWNAFLAAPSSFPATIRGFWIRNANAQVSISDAILNVYNNIVISDSGWTNLITGTGGGDIRNNLFSGSTGCIQIAAFWGTFFNNIVQNAEEWGMWNAAVNRNPLIYDYNSLWNNSNNYNDRFESKPGDIYADPLLNLEGGYLEEGSPCIDTGNPEILDLDGTRSDIGPFGGSWAYINN